MPPDRAVVHDLANVSQARFDTLRKALQYVHENKVTGYVALWTPEDGAEVINVKKGKRPGLKKGTWVPCL